MKAIMISIRPEWVAKILNGEKTIEIRKKFPKDYVGWVYIYVTHGKQLLDLRNEDTKDNYRLTERKSNNVRWSYPPLLNGTVIARFWCDKVDVVYKPTDTIHKSTITFNEIMKKGCLTKQELTEYRCKGGISDIYAIHITKLEIFDKPKDISEFSVKVFPHRKDNLMTRYLTRAPQSWCYVEI